MLAVSCGLRRRKFQQEIPRHCFRLNLPFMRTLATNFGVGKHRGPGQLSNYGAGFGDLDALGSHGSFEVATAAVRQQGLHGRCWRSRYALC